MTTWCKPVAIPVQPWSADHCFMGKIVLPAVETMLLLAAAAAEIDQTLDIQVMHHVRFARFLEIPAGSTTVEALLEYRKNEDGVLHVKLMSRRQFKAMTRLQEHGEICFAPARTDRLKFVERLPADLDEPAISIPAKQVYRELVPFGPSYQTLREAVYLFDQGAWGKLQAPALPLADRGGDGLGSPFPLDGALHVACVLGQRFLDFVPFPVGFASRIIVRPTQPGGSYRTRVQLLSLARDEMVCDLNIFDDQGQVYERVTGVRMRDVSNGRIKPPAWMHEVQQ